MENYLRSKKEQAPYERKCREMWSTGSHHNTTVSVVRKTYDDEDEDDEDKYEDEYEEKDDDDDGDDDGGHDGNDEYVSINIHIYI